MEWNIASSGGTGSRLTRVLIIISGVASLVATLLSIVYVTKPLYFIHDTDDILICQVDMATNVRAQSLNIMDPI